MPADDDSRPRPPQTIFHVGFVVRDLDAAIDFYCTGLGLELRHRQLQDNPYTRSLVAYDDAVLEIAQLRFSDQPPPPSGHVIELIRYLQPQGKDADRERNTVAAGHIGFVVEDVDGIAARLVQLGATLLNEPVDITAGINKGGRLVYLQDPDGVTVELVQLPPKPKSVAGERAR
ncbi:MAG: VOC family protein [Actinomycetota bacterium]|nr:VOC family protein [Actinomycetota bacterium]